MTQKIDLENLAQDLLHIFQKHSIPFQGFQINIGLDVVSFDANFSHHPDLVQKFFARRLGETEGVSWGVQVTRPQTNELNWDQIREMQRTG